MPLSPEQEALCERLENGESTPTAAALIRQQAHEIDDLWDRLSRSYALVRAEASSPNSSPVAYFNTPFNCSTAELAAACVSN